MEKDAIEVLKCTNSIKFLRQIYLFILAVLLAYIRRAQLATLRET